MKTMISYVHDCLKDSYVDVAIDFTMGNGLDTLFLSTIARHVYSFDIQPVAIENTKKKLGDIKNVSLILDSHVYFDKYVDTFSIGIFNLGYLPNGNHAITTMADTTLFTLNKAIAKMKQKGRLFLVIYIGHEQGKQESEQIDAYVSKLNHKDYNVASYRMLNKENAPYVIEIEKR